MSDTDTEFGDDLISALKEVKAHRRGEIALPARSVSAMPASRVRAIRKAVAKSPREFEARFGLPARTLEGWEQGRKLDVASRLLLLTIEKEPDAVERAWKSERQVEQE
ncbi:MAG: helix-turn-helix domain-containing protein [Caulobacteraceae bacterium]